MLSEQQQPCSQDRGTLTVRNGLTVTAPCRIFPKCSSTYPSFIEPLDQAKGRVVTHHNSPEGRSRVVTHYNSSPEGRAVTDYNSPEGRAVTHYNSPEGRAITDYNSPEGRAVTDYNSPEGRAITHYNSPEGRAVTHYNSQRMLFSKLTLHSGLRSHLPIAGTSEVNHIFKVCLCIFCSLALCSIIAVAFTLHKCTQDIHHRHVCR